MSVATFKAIIRAEGAMVAGLVAIPEGNARLFIRQKRESEEAFAGRVSAWVKEQGAESMAMHPPEVLTEGLESGEVLMRIKHSLGIPRNEPDQPAYDVENVEVVWSGKDGPLGQPN